MNKKVVATQLGPSAIGPYSQAIRVGKMVFVSGQIPFDPATSQIIDDKGIRAQTQRAIRNMLAILFAAGGSVNDVVKTTVFLKDINDFAEMNAAYAEFFHTSAPARSTVEVARLPRDVSIEIDCIAILE